MWQSVERLKTVEENIDNDIPFISQITQQNGNKTDQEIIYSKYTRNIIVLMFDQQTSV